MDRIGKRVGVRIQQIRKSQNLTQAKLAEKTDLSENFIGSIERGVRIPSLGALEKISQALRVKMKDLFDFPEEGYYPGIYEKMVTSLDGFIKERSADEVELILDIAK
ncbi:MAG: transcriptional regulator, partial [Deltaproteobacteria bacterium CG12_big_fil_rev_8_21_14_0_65_43_10]